VFEPVVDIAFINVVFSYYYFWIFLKYRSDNIQLLIRKYFACRVVRSIYHQHPCLFAEGFLKLCRIECPLILLLKFNSILDPFLEALWRLFVFGKQRHSYKLGIKHLNLLAVTSKERLENNYFISLIDKSCQRSA
jgi:hypothetical protein